MKLLLFDIDHTLLFTGGCGTKALNYAFKEVFNLSDGMKGIPVAGRTDPLIVMDVVRANFNREATQREIDEAMSAYAQRLQSEINDISKGHLKNGVIELLEILQKDKENLLGVLTGNIKKGADIKLEAFNISGYFELGAYSSDYADRNKLVPVAVNRAEKISAGNFSIGDPVIVIGDTPYDVACAKAGGAYSIAVATGPYSVDVLKESAPDLIINDFVTGKSEFLDFIASV